VSAVEGVVVGVELVEPEDVVVVPVPAVAVAMTGEAFAAVGADATIPVVSELLGYGVHVRLRVLPDTTNPSEMAGSTVTVMAPPDAVKGPTVPGVEGRFRARPVVGTGLGIGASMVIGGAATEAGVAPVASTLRLAVPVMAEFPRAAAAETMEEGSATTD